MNINIIYNIKVSFLWCSDKILFNLQIPKKHTLEENKFTSCNLVQNGRIENFVRPQT